MIDQNGQEKEIRDWIMTLHQRCKAATVCGEVMNCLKIGDWDAVIRCCEVQLDGYQRSFDINGKALLNAQLGTAHLMKGTIDKALKCYKESVDIFRINNRINAGLMLMALGRIYEISGDFRQAAQCYREGLDFLSDMRDPLVAKASEWYARFKQNIREHPIGKQPDTGIGDQAETDYERMQGSPQPVEQASTPATHSQSISNQVHVPSTFPRLALFPVCEDRVPAGKPVVPFGGIASYATTMTVCIDDSQFYLRDILDKSGELKVGNLGFAMIVKGTSMEPTIHDGDCILVRKMEPFAGDIVVIRVSDTLNEDRITVKRFYPEKDHILLLPDNQAAETIIITAQDALVEIIKGYYRHLVADDRLQVVVGTEEMIVGKVIAILSPLPASQ